MNPAVLSALITATGIALVGSFTLYITKRTASNTARNDLIDQNQEDSSRWYARAVAEGAQKDWERTMKEHYNEEALTYRRGIVEGAYPNRDPGPRPATPTRPNN